MRMCTYRDEWHAGDFHASRIHVVLVCFVNIYGCVLSELKLLGRRVCA
jgi:hypothetical protein